MNSTRVNPASSANLHLAFDVGHSSIGWAVLRRNAPLPALPEILGTGVVTFGADDCLAVKRRQNRQARRHVRATRQRIGRMETLLAHLGVMSAAELKSRHEQAGGDSFAWQKAAAILAAARAGKPAPATTWPELWDILRWYAHNRGYFAPPWTNRGEEAAPQDEDEVPDTEKVKLGLALMHGEHPQAKLHTETMAETIAAYTIWYEREAARWQQRHRSDKPAHFKGLKVAFPRDEVVWPEVRALLTALGSHLPGVDDALIRTLLGNDVDPMKDRDAWKTIPCPAIQLPKRYHGGLLFGQSIPRFDNRIIGACPIQFARLEAKYRAEGLDAGTAKRRAEKESKLPSKASLEFLRFRWAMQLANIFGGAPGERATVPLNAEARRKLTEQAAREGSFTKGDFKKAVRAAAGWPEKPARDNLDSMLMHPDAEEALVFDPVQAALRKHDLREAFAGLPPRFIKRLRGKLARGKAVTPQAVRDWLTGTGQVTRDSVLDCGSPLPLSGRRPDDEKAEEDCRTTKPHGASSPLAKFDAELQRVLDAANTRKGRKQSALTREQLLSEPVRAKFPSGRAPYARPTRARC